MDKEYIKESEDLSYFFDSFIYKFQCFSHMSFDRTTIEENREDKQTRRYDMLKLLSILQNNDTHSTKVKKLSLLTEKDRITGEELLKKLENGELNILCKREKIKN